MRVKVCGLTLIRDLRLAEAAGAEYVGFVVEAVSPRAVSRQVAAVLARAARAKPVFVLVDMPIDELRDLLTLRRPAALQLHGSESPDYVRQLRDLAGDQTEIWKALPLQDPADLDSVCSQAQTYAEAGAARILLDTRIGPRDDRASPAFPIEIAAEAVSKMPLPCIIAGGLTPEILPDLWHQAQPWAVDLSSSLERQPGVKDPARMKALAQILSSSP